MREILILTDWKSSRICFKIIIKKKNKKKKTKKNFFLNAFSLYLSMNIKIDPLKETNTFKRKLVDHTVQFW